MDEAQDSIEITCIKCQTKFMESIEGTPGQTTPVCPHCGFHVFTDGTTQILFSQAVEKRLIQIERENLSRTNEQRLKKS